MTSSKPIKTKSPEDAMSSDLPQLPFKSSVSGQKWSFWTVFSSTFITIFFAEMGDKTQLATLLMSAQSQSPGVVFIGAAAALITTSLLGVLIGYWLAKRLSPKTLNLAVAMLLLIIAIWLVIDIIN